MEFMANLDSQNLDRSEFWCKISSSPRIRNGTWKISQLKRGSKGAIALSNALADLLLDCRKAVKVPPSVNDVNERRMQITSNFFPHNNFCSSPVTKVFLLLEFLFGMYFSQTRLGIFPLPILATQLNGVLPLQPRRYSPKQGRAADKESMTSDIYQNGWTFLDLNKGANGIVYDHQRSRVDHDSHQNSCQWVQPVQCHPHSVRNYAFWRHRG